MTASVRSKIHRCKNIKISQKLQQTEKYVLEKMLIDRSSEKIADPRPHPLSQPLLVLLKATF